jgi:hypothetical protein
MRRRLLLFVNPCLNAEVKDGKIVSFRRTNA